MTIEVEPPSESIDVAIGDDAKARRRVVTTEGLGVAEALLGRRLASPGRRLTALLVDLGLVALLTTLTTGLIFSAVVAVLVLWLCVRGARGWLSWAWRLPAGALVALFTFFLVAAVTTDDVIVGHGESWQAFGEAMGSADPAVQRAAMERLAADLDQELSDEDLAEIASQLGIELTTRPKDEAIDVDDEVARLGAQLRDLRQQLLDLVRENQQLRAELDDPSLLRSVEAVAGDLGLEVGWAGVYFLLFPALWRGRTPGKWLLRLRVVRLDGRPLGVWNAFERLGGYAAGLATGLLGFLQVTWDPNRQGVHDKIVGTVVVVEESSTPR